MSAAFTLIMQLMPALDTVAVLHGVTHHALVHNQVMGCCVMRHHQC